MSLLHFGSHADLLAQNAFARQNSVREILERRVAAKEQQFVARDGRLGADGEGRARETDQASEVEVPFDESVLDDDGPEGGKVEEAKDSFSERIAGSADAPRDESAPLVSATVTTAVAAASATADAASASVQEQTPFTPLQNQLSVSSHVPKWWVISIKVVRAYGLAKVDWGLFSKSDPYVQVLLNGRSVVLTDVVHRSLNPVWNLQRNFDLHAQPDNGEIAPGPQGSFTLEDTLKGTSLDFRVYDEDYHEDAKPTFLGRVKFEGNDLVDLCRLGQEGKTMACKLVADPVHVVHETQSTGKKKAQTRIQAKESSSSSLSSSRSTKSLKIARKSPRFRSLKKSRTVGDLVDLVQPRGKLVVQASVRLMSGVHTAFNTPNQGSNPDLLEDDWGLESMSELESSSKAPEDRDISSSVDGYAIMKTPDRRAVVRQRFQHASAIAVTRSHRKSPCTPRTPKMQLMALQEMRERDRKTALDECERDLHALDTELRMLFRVGVAASVTWHFFQWWQWDTVGMSVSSWLWGYCAGTLSYVLTVVACFLARRAYHSFAFDQIKTKRVMRLTAVERAHADTKKMEMRVGKGSKSVAKKLRMKAVKRFSLAKAKSSNLRGSSSPMSAASRSGIGEESKTSSSSSNSASASKYDNFTSVDTRPDLRGSQSSASNHAIEEKTGNESKDDSSQELVAGEKTGTGDALDSANSETADPRNDYDPASLDAWRAANPGDPYLQSITTSETKNLNLLVKRIRHLGKYYPYLDRLTALRFLRARDNDIDKAEEMFRNMVAWYDANNILAIAQDPYPRITGKGQTYDALPFYPGGQAGRDRDGDPVLWGRQGLVDTVSLLRRYKIIDVQREAIRRYESVLRMHRDDAAALGEYAEGGTKAHFQLTAILDVKGLGWKHTDSYGFKVLKLVQDLARDYYPELLKRALIVRPPRVFSIVWTAIRWFIDPKTREKIVIASGTDAEVLKIIEEHINRKYIPDYLGGDMKTRGLEAERAVKREKKVVAVEKGSGAGEEKHAGEEEEEEEEWIEGLQEDGKVFKATISEGGVIPDRLLKHAKYKRPHVEGEEVMLKGTPSLEKYHEE